MTTIAFRKYKDHVEMSGDTFTSGGWPGRPTKLYKTNQYLAGFAGSYVGIQRMIDALRTAGFKRYADLGVGLSPKDGPLGLLWEVKTKKLWYFEKVGPWLPTTKCDYLSIGSGCEYALGAMAVNKNSREAVYAAAMLDAHTRAPVHTLKIKL